MASAHRDVDILLVIPPSRAATADLLTSISGLAYAAVLEERLQLAADALRAHGARAVQIIVAGRRAASTAALVGSPAFVFEPDLVARKRRGCFAVVESLEPAGAKPIPLSAWNELAAFGRPVEQPRADARILLLGTPAYRFGLISLEIESAERLPPEALRIWTDVLSSLIESDLRAELADHVEHVTEALRTERDIESVLSIVTDALAQELGSVCSAWRFERDRWQPLVTSPFAARKRDAVLDGIVFERCEPVIAGEIFAIPLLVDGRVWGALSLENAAIDERLRGFVSVIAAHGQLALTNAIAFARERRLAGESATLSEAGRTLLGFTRLEAMAREACALGRDIAQAEAATLYVLGADGYTCAGLAAPDDLAIDIPTDELDATRRSGTPALREDGRCLILPLQALDAEEAVHLACLVFRRRANTSAFSRETIRFLEAYGTLCALALRNVQLFEETVLITRELTESNSFKDDLLAMFTHDFKGPLSVIAGYGELVLDKLQGDERDCLSIILKQVKRLVTLADDALALARAQATGFILDPKLGDLAAFVKDVVETSFGPEKSRVVLVLRKQQIEVGFDTIAMRHVLENLVGNALKYSDDRVEVEVVEENGEAGVIVRDHGIGIPADELLHVFERFTRGSNARRRGIHGSGVGLYISQRLVEQQGGRIFAGSSEGEGSTFDVRLPINRRKASR